MKTIVGVLFGWIGILIVMFVASIVLGLLLRFTSLADFTLQWATLLISFLALFTGGFIAGIKAKHKGMLVGGLTSLLFTFFVFCYQYLGLGATFTIVEIVHHTAFLLLAIIGAIIGVNMSDSQEKESY
ncbi:TIGR04086 family membrane protein [Gracilibacillus sp. YIM 98692]|uniref:TIGR04086 family membrane protein n=1 Tax=Gracilibacillus sp. YIM 98692 TaxID=2663532 RepID=UPI0013D37907|nr:TIGR04086 family membrane protein [Gracilibacillus sp. YIM 98692]